MGTIGCKNKKVVLKANKINIAGWQSILYGHTYSKSMDQPGEVANPARGRLNKEGEYFPVGFGSPVPRQPAHLHTRA